MLNGSNINLSRKRREDRDLERAKARFLIEPNHAKNTIEYKIYEWILELGKICDINDD